MSHGKRPGETMRVLGRWPRRGDSLADLWSLLRERERKPSSMPFTVSSTVQALANLDGVVAVYITTDGTGSLRGLRLAVVASKSPRVGRVRRWVRRATQRRVAFLRVDPLRPCDARALLGENLLEDLT